MSYFATWVSYTLATISGWLILCYFDLTHTSDEDIFQIILGAALALSCHWWVNRGKGKL